MEELDVVGEVREKVLAFVEDFEGVATVEQQLREHRQVSGQRRCFLEDLDAHFEKSTLQFCVLAL